MKKAIGLILIVIVIITGIVIHLKLGNQPEETVPENEQATSEDDDNIIVFSEPEDIIRINIATKEELPSSKDEGTINTLLKVSVNDDTYETYGTIAVQGTSTAKRPKKNWSLKLYKDKARKESLKMKIGDSIASDQWITKAEWIDPSMLRNAVSYRLWGSMTASRTIEPQYEVNNVPVNKQIEGAQGFPKTYAALVTVNGEHYGLAILTLGHDPDNFNIDKDNPRHAYLEFDARHGYTDVKTWEKFKSEGIGEWIDGYWPKNDDFSNELKDSIDSLGKLINGPLEEFKANFDNHLDKTNIIDMLLFIEAIHDWDSVAQDIEMVTYDLKKWYFLPWDKDITFGLRWDLTGLVENSENKLVLSYDELKTPQMPWYKTYHAFTDEVEARYRELREKGVFTSQNLDTLAQEITSKITEDMRKQEYDRWIEEGRPSVEEATHEQLITWFEQKLKTMDKNFNY